MAKRATWKPKAMTTSNEYEITTTGAEQTIALGRAIGGSLTGGQVIALTGELGSGKTHLIKGIAAGAGASEEQHVSSPTFVLVNEYAGENCGLYLYHIDAYRLESVAEFEMLGFDDLCRPDSVVMIEWADKIESALGNIETINIELLHIDQTKRKIIIKNVPAHILQVLKKIKPGNRLYS